MSIPHIHLRRAQGSDTARLMAPYRESSRDPLSQTATPDGEVYLAGVVEAFAKDENNQLLVAELGGEVVGTFQLTFRWRPSGWTRTIAARASARR